jgi:hypothetical protein
MSSPSIRTLFGRSSSAFPSACCFQRDTSCFKIPLLAAALIHYDNCGHTVVIPALTTVGGNQLSLDLLLSFPVSDRSSVAGDGPRSDCCWRSLLRCLHDGQPACPLPASLCLRNRQERGVQPDTDTVWVPGQRLCIPFGSLQNLDQLFL